MIPPVYKNGVQQLYGTSAEHKEKVITLTRREQPTRFGPTWLYTITVPGEKYPFIGKGIDWARHTAKKYSKKTSFKVVEKF